MPSETRPVALVTGGNTGLGFAIAQSLLTSPAEPLVVIITSRSLDKATEAAQKLKVDSTSEVVGLQLDLLDDESIEKIRQDVQDKYGRLDILINNAGVSQDYDVSYGKKTVRQAFLDTFNTNVAGPHVLTEAFIPLLLTSPIRRIIFISSSVGSFKEHSNPIMPINASPPAGWPKPTMFVAPTYRTSKSAMNMMVLEWGRTLKEDDVKIHTVNPGLLATNLVGAGADEMRKYGADEPEVAGDFIRTIVDGKHDHETLVMISGDGVVEW